MVFFHGVLMGVTMAVVFGFGPAFFLLIQTSISKGFKHALLFDLGVMLSDILVVVLMMMTTIRLSFDGGSNIIFPGVAAGLIVIAFGIYTYRSKPEKIVAKSEQKRAELEEVEKRFEMIDERLEIRDRKRVPARKGPRWYVYVSKGFVMNIFNPFIWIFWMTCVATTTGQYDGRKDLVALFFLGVFTTVLFFDILKIIGAYSLKRFFTETRMRFLNQGTGIVLMICGVVLIIKVLFFN
ncbi:MAG: LysE family translocator [Candidatus Limimorpha sp.]